MESVGSESAPAVGSAAEGAPGGTVAAGGDTAASALTGSAPGGGVDAGVVGDAPGDGPAASAAAKFRFLNREFNDSKHAETILGSEITRARTTQRDLSTAQRELEKAKAEAESLRAVVVQLQGGVQGQGVPRGSQGGPRSFARELAESGELEVIAKIFADPEMGPAHAMYRMAELLDERGGKQLEQVREEIRTELTQQQTRVQQERAVAKGIGAARTLAETYPELDDANQSEEAIAAQQEVLRIIEDTFTPEQLARNPERVLRMAVEEYRRSYGTPVFAQPPGTSGSPSVRAAAAAEAQAASVAGTPMDGSGLPRQRATGQPESPVERIKRENRELNKRIATTPSGRPLGFEA